MAANTTAMRKAIKAGDALVRTFEALPGRQRREGIPSMVVPAGYERDAQKSRVYAAENTFAELVRNRGDYPRANLSGLSVDVPDMLRFGDLSAVQTFTDAVTEHVGASRITVRTNVRLAKGANYAGGIITLPLAGTDPRWAWTAAVVLHEIAHHLTNGARHNAPFPSQLVELFTDWISPEAGLLLRVLYVEHGAKL